MPTISKVARMEMRPPQINRLRMSRPRSSVPSQCAAEGPALIMLRFCRFGRVRGDERGEDGRHDDEQQEGQAADGERLVAEAVPEARAAAVSASLRPRHVVRQRAAGRPGPTNGSWLKWGEGQAHAEADLGVEVAVDDVDDQVDEHERGGGDEHDALDHREVLLGDGLEDVLADAGQREDLLDDQRAAQQVAELDPDDGDRRAERVLQGVLADDRPVCSVPSPRRCACSPGRGCR